MGADRSRHARRIGVGFRSHQENQRARFQGEDQLLHAHTESGYRQDPRLRHRQRGHGDSHRLSQAEISFSLDLKDVLKRSIEVINYAKDKELHVVYFPYDTTRAREDYLKHLLDGNVESSRLDAVGVVDTMGCALPQAIVHLVRTVKDITAPADGNPHSQGLSPGGGQ